MRSANASPSVALGEHCSENEVSATPSSPRAKTRALGERSPSAPLALGDIPTPSREKFTVTAILPSAHHNDVWRRFDALSFLFFYFFSANTLPRVQAQRSAKAEVCRELWSLLSAKLRTWVFCGSATPRFAERNCHSSRRRSPLPRATLGESGN